MHVGFNKVRGGDATELAWEYCNRIRRGEHPSLNEFRNGLPDEKSKQEFDLLVNMDEFLRQSVNYKRRRH